MNQSGDPCTDESSTALGSTQQVGKIVRGDLYFHVSAEAHMSVVVQAALLKACELVGLKPSVDFNVVKIGRGKTVVSLLDYANFFDDAFPRLKKVCTVNLTEKRSSVRTYQPDANPPILHRKELLLRFDDPSRPLFEKLTRDLDGRGIKPDKPRLGFQNQWNEYLAEMGVAIHKHKFAELANGHD